MSISAQIWKQIGSGANVSGRKPPVPAAAMARLGNLSEAPAFSLMHQLFFPSATLRRTSILFAAADARSRASALCEQIAIALSKVSGEMVGIVEACSSLNRNPWTKKGMPSSFGRGLWQVYSSRLSEGIWRIPPALLGNECGASRDSTSDGLKELRSTFKYFLFSAAINESETPILCNLCQAAVLVLTANVTRRETALRAKEQLLRQGVTLLGTVLDERTLPIPESIYRRL
ncbi:MAG: hypothetical protein JWN74_3793 [Acidobacteriaceae bacterium]|nr:hypothetical protein [Acidobacteriaceae bacterium]